MWARTSATHSSNLTEHMEKNFYLNQYFKNCPTVREIMRGGGERDLMMKFYLRFYFFQSCWSHFHSPQEATSTSSSTSHKDRNHVPPFYANGQFHFDAAYTL